MSQHDLIPRAILHPLGVAYIHTRNPWLAAWWSVILPGFGHFYLGSNVKGFLLMSWEIVVNTKANLNLAIFYTLLGDYEKATAVIDYEWAMIYPLFYIFSMIDSYRLAVQYNRYAELERLQKRRRFDRLAVSSLGVVGIDRRNPLVAGFWSFCMSGLGHFYANRMLKAVILMGWQIAIIVKSGLSVAAYYTFLGQWELIPHVVDYQWLLFWPSVYVFGMVDAYSDTVEQNNLADMAFRHRLRKYLNDE